MASLRSCTQRSATNRCRTATVFAAFKPHACHTTTAPPQPHTRNPIAAPLVLAAVSTLLTATPALAIEVPELFANKCAGCHMNGGNVLAVGATLFPEDLRRNGVDSSEALYRIIYGGKGKMPGFGKDCAPKGACTFGPRLSDEEVTSLAAYVQDRAAAGWKQ
ncbi:hypothetical protein PLESTB_000702000 [Pleodorina starrii]|uniref:Cytochrome c-553 n=1 Tax=Pleodorina starrii TaxID=330485 RepID=A0A9W6BJ18_9CHLO|nr:hypothetical protein PLESTM_001214700 [Pleodorina starrii]GLC53044.1 hypothetical protein PLESTB_000702000 [Pleodorina starrii]